jgi:hypothetical protein
MDSTVNVTAAASRSRRQSQTSAYPALSRPIAPVIIAQEIRRFSWYNAAWILMYLYCLALSFLVIFSLTSDVIWKEPYYINPNILPLVETLLSAMSVLYVFILLFAPSMQWAIDKLTRRIKAQSLKRSTEWVLWTLLIAPCLCLGLLPLGPVIDFRFILLAIFSKN